MKMLVFAALLFSSTHAFAAAQLTCGSEDGSSLQATIDSTNSLSQIRIGVRDGALQTIPGASVAALVIERTTDGEEVKSLVVKDSRGQILLAFTSNILVDNSGSYSARCEIAY